MCGALGGNSAKNCNITASLLHGILHNEIKAGCGTLWVWWANERGWSCVERLVLKWIIPALRNQYVLHVVLASDSPNLLLFPKQSRILPPVVLRNFANNIPMPVY